MGKPNQIMKNTLNMKMLLAIGWLTLPVLPALAQWRETPSQPLINVSGSAEVKVAPDEVDLSASVESHNPSLDAAKQENDRHIKQALEFLRRQGVKDKDIQTDYINIEPVFKDGQRIYSSNMEGWLPKDDDVKPIYYVVRKGLSVKLTDTEKFDAVLTGLITNGVNYVQGIDFRTTQLRKYKDQARVMAIRAAREKADAMAEELGVKVGKPYAINVTDTGGWNSWYGGGSRFRGFGGYGMANQNAVQNAGGPGDTGGNLAVGQISVSVSVDVSFLIQ